MAEFTLVRRQPRATSAAFALCVVGACVLGVVVFLALFDVVSRAVLIPVAVLILATLIPTILGFWNQAGTVVLDQHGLSVRRNKRIFEVPWEDIAEVSLASANAGLFGLTARTGSKQAYVRVQLTRSFRVKVIPGVSGTRVPGIPSGFLKELQFFVDQPAALAAEMASHMVGPGAVPPTTSGT